MKEYSHKSKLNTQPPTKDTYVWYAAYGSNMCEDRFFAYIKGGMIPGNSRVESGCQNTALPSKTDTIVVPGCMFFGNRSRRWNNMGVAFYDKNGQGFTHMKLYKITSDQLDDLQKQEGNSPNWYGERVFLGFHNDGFPIFTFTATNLPQRNPPCKEYYEIVLRGLMNTFGFSKSKAQSIIPINQ